MASTSQKKTTKKTSGKSGSRTTAKKPQPRPIRREVGGVVCLVLALCVFVSYFGISAIFIDWLAVLIKGLLGYGYWLFGPALVLAGCILLFHHGRPVTLRVTSALLLPVLLGTLCHMLLVKEAYASSIGIIPAMWKDGVALKCGGVISGALGQGSVAVFSKIASIIIFTVLFVVLLMVALRLTVGALIEKHRERPKYEEEPEPEKPVREAKRPQETVAAIPAESARSRIDIPVDDPVNAPAPKPEKTGFTSFFRHKSDKQKTPAQVVAQSGTAEPVVSVMEDEGDPFANARVHPSPAPAPVPIGQQPPVKAIPTMEPVVVSTPAEQPENAPVPAAVNTPAQGTAPAAAPAVQEPLTKKAAAQAVAAETAAVTAEIAENMAGSEAEYRYPPVSLLHENGGENHMAAGAELRNNSRRLAETLASFGVDAKAGDVIHGPSVTRYEVQPMAGVKISRITSLADDIALNLAVADVRMEAPIPGKPAVGIEVPNHKKTPVYIRSVFESQSFLRMTSPMGIALGKDIAGVAQVADLCKMPHLLIAGSTGSGKSVCVNSIIMSLLFRSSPEDVKLLLIDPKVVELAEYNGIPHLLMPVVTEPRKAAGALGGAVQEMERRYHLFAENNVRDIKSFNKLAATDPNLEKMPYIAIIIDELADLMMVVGKDVEDSICRIAQKARAAGMHLIVATQRPSVDVITGLIKANIPSRIAFAVSSQVDSRTILDGAGAEKLLGMGDMLFMPVGAPKPTRIQGTFVRDEEISRVLDFIKKSATVQYDEAMIEAMEKHAIQDGKKGSSGADSDDESDSDPMFQQAVEVVIDAGQASTSLLQRRCKLGYARAARIMDEMEMRGIIGPHEGAKPRAVLISRQQWLEMQMNQPEE